MSDIFIPEGCESLAQMAPEQQIRLGIQGYFNTGKTWAGLTFPNPMVLNLDKGLGAHSGRPDVHEIKMWKPSFVDAIIPRDGVNAPPNRRDAILVWLAKVGVKLTANQTLLFDGSTQLQNAFVAQYNLNPRLTKAGKVDDFGLWNEKVDYFGQVCELFKSLSCHVVYVSHETPDRNKEGELNGQVRPLLTGQFGDQIGSHFTDWFRALVVAKPTTDERLAKFKTAFGLDDITAKEWINSTPTTHQSIYIWHARG